MDYLSTILKESQWAAFLYALLEITLKYYSHSSCKTHISLFLQMLQLCMVHASHKPNLKFSLHNLKCWPRIQTKSLMDFNKFRIKV